MSGLPSVATELRTFRIGSYVPNRKAPTAALGATRTCPHRELSGLDLMKNSSVVHDHEAAIRAIIELFACD